MGESKTSFLAPNVLAQTSSLWSRKRGKFGLVRVMGKVVRSFRRIKKLRSTQVGDQTVIASRANYPRDLFEPRRGHCEGCVTNSLIITKFSVEHCEDAFHKLSFTYESNKIRCM